MAIGIAGPATAACSFATQWFCAVSVRGTIWYTKEHAIAATARFDVRLNSAEKACVSRAAELRGVSLSAFVRDAVLREAETVVAAELTVTLSVAESRRFLDALDKPFKPSARLKNAMKRGLVPR